MGSEYLARGIQVPSTLLLTFSVAMTGQLVQLYVLST